MRQRNRHSGLIAINAVLLAALALAVFMPAGASAEPPKRSRGDYTMVSGRVQGIVESAIYIIDSSNQELIALRWDRSRKSLSGMGFRDMAQDTKSSKARGR